MNTNEQNHNFSNKFTTVIRATITFALILDALIMFRIFEIDSQKQTVERKNEHIATDFKLFVSPAYHPTDARLQTEKQMLADEQKTFERLSANTMLANRSQANIIKMRNTIRMLEDSLRTMEVHARSKANTQYKMSNAESFWEKMATYSGIVLGAVIAPMFVISFLWQFVEVPAKFRYLSKHRVDWTFFVSLIVKLAYATTFILQWDRLFELLGSMRACYFAGIYAPGLSIICSLYLFSFERRMYELDSGTAVAENISPEEKPHQNVHDDEQNNGKVEVHFSRVNHWHALPETNPIKTPNVFEPQVNAPQLVEVFAEEQNRTVIGRPRLLPSMWDSLEKAKESWKDTLLTSNVLEIMADNRKFDIWYDVPPPTNREQAKRFMRLLILNNQQRRGDRLFLVNFLKDETITAESLRRAIQNAQVLANSNPRSKRIELLKSDIKGYIQMGIAAPSGIPNTSPNINGNAKA